MATSDGRRDMSTGSGSTDRAVEAAPEPGWRVAARSDLGACVDADLHRIVPAIFVVALGTAGVATALLSEAFYATGDLPGTIRLLSSDAAWLFGSLVALVGLFVGYPTFEGGRGGSARDTLSRGASTRDALSHGAPTRDAVSRGGSARERFVGRLISRWLIVGGGVLVGFLALCVVAVVAYDPFSPLAFVAFALSTAALSLAYAGLGVAVSTAAGTRRRALAWLLAAFFGLIVLWDTWVLPLGLLLIAAGGNPDVLAARPGWFDGLVAASPGGAYAEIGAALVADSGGISVTVAVAALVAWILAPPAIAFALATRRYR